MQLVLTPLQGIPLVEEGNDLAEFIRHSLQLDEINLQNGDVLVLAQKIVSKAEGQRQTKSKDCHSSDEAVRLAGTFRKGMPEFIQVFLNESKATDSHPRTH